MSMDADGDLGMGKAYLEVNKGERCRIFLEKERYFAGGGGSNILCFVSISVIWVQSEFLGGGLYLM